MIRWVGYTTSYPASVVVSDYSAAANVCSNSWGRIFGLGRFSTEGSALQSALQILASRNVISLYASGNGHREWSRCAHQDLTAGPYVIQVAAASDKGKKSAYSSECPAVFISAPSGDSRWYNSTRLGIPTASTGGGCTESFSGTSAATPTVSGVVALMKQAQPSLAIRDIQWILINNSDPIDSLDSSWTINSAGYRHSHKYGFGRLNARKAVAAAASWTTLAPAFFTSPSLSVSNPFWRSPNLFIPDAGAVVMDTMPVSGFAADAKIEHVGLYVKSDHTLKNQLELNLTSPSGTEAQFLIPFATTQVYDATGSGGQACTSESPILSRARSSSHSLSSCLSVLERFIVPNLVLVQLLPLLWLL